jgi:hypothetical protein
VKRAWLAIAAISLAAPLSLRAAPCPADRFALWSNGVLRGANVFQGRNPGGASNGIGDGDFAQSPPSATARILPSWASR